MPAQLAKPRITAPPESVTIGDLVIPVIYRRRPQARRYILRVTADGVASVTIPRGGSAREARHFVDRQSPWLAAQWRKFLARVVPPVSESGVFYRGERVPVLVGLDGVARFGDQTLAIAPGDRDLRTAIKERLRLVATRELPARLAELAAREGLAVRRVSIRDQRSRWGSCSARGVISLNWRLVQMPDFVRDYIIMHELIHRREMNHSARYWQLVRTAFPETDAAEQWLRRNSAGLREL